MCAMEGKYDIYVDLAEYGTDYTSKVYFRTGRIAGLDYFSLFDELDVNEPIDVLVEITVADMEPISKKSKGIAYKISRKWTDGIAVKKSYDTLEVKLFKNEEIGLNEDRVYAYNKKNMPNMIKKI